MVDKTSYPRSRALLIDSSRKSGRGKCECASRTYMKELVTITTNDCKRLHVHAFALSEGKQK